MNSTHQVEVVPIILEKHHNADSLSVVTIFGGYTCCVRTEDWLNVNIGAYVPPDSIVDTTRPEFSFLTERVKIDGTHRVKAKKLRGIVSFGLLIPAPAGSNLGDDVAEQLGVTHYEPPILGQQKDNLLTGGEAAKGPNLYSPKYDLDTFRKFHYLLSEGEPIWITEKIHGCCARYVYHNGQMYCDSRFEWKKEYPDYSHITLEYLKEHLSKGFCKFCGASNEDLNGQSKCEKCPDAQKVFDRLHNKPKPRNLWWNANVVEQWCKDHPDVIVYGEVFGQIQTLKYGVSSNEPYKFAAFDLMVNGQWLCPLEAQEVGQGLPWVPILAKNVPYSFDLVVRLSDGPSTWPGANHYREGCVVKPMTERLDPHVGRVCIKCVGATYLEKDK